jgi:hypothetical protein
VHDARDSGRLVSRATGVVVAPRRRAPGRSVPSGRVWAAASRRYRRPRPRRAEPSGARSGSLRRRPRSAR